MTRTESGKKEKNKSSKGGETGTTSPSGGGGDTQRRRKKSVEAGLSMTVNVEMKKEEEEGGVTLSQSSSEGGKERKEVKKLIEDMKSEDNEKNILKSESDKNKVTIDAITLEKSIEIITSINTIDKINRNDFTLAFIITFQYFTSMKEIIQLLSFRINLLIEKYDKQYKQDIVIPTIIRISNLIRQIVDFHPFHFLRFPSDFNVCLFTFSFPFPSLSPSPPLSSPPFPLFHLLANLIFSIMFFPPSPCSSLVIIPYHTILCHTILYYTILCPPLPCYFPPLPSPLSSWWKSLSKRV